MYGMLIAWRILANSFRYVHRNCFQNTSCRPHSTSLQHPSVFMNKSALWPAAMVSQKNNQNIRKSPLSVFQILLRTQRVSHFSYYVNFGLNSSTVAFSTDLENQSKSGVERQLRWMNEFLRIEQKWVKWNLDPCTPFRYVRTVMN